MLNYLSLRTTINGSDMDHNGISHCTHPIYFHRLNKKRYYKQGEWKVKEAKILGKSNSFQI